MKLMLVVADGVHQGKTIPVNVAEFRIGRDPDCQLRPASPSISKRHCAIIQRDGKVFVHEFGSTNGTFVNNEQIAGEHELANGDSLKAGPLSFTVRLEGTAAVMAAVKAAPLKAAVAAKAAVTVGGGDADSDAMAMMLLSDGDEDTPPSASATGTVESMIPDGTTIMEMPAVKTDEKKDDKKSKGFNADTGSAAAAILSKYMRRPRT